MTQSRGLSLLLKKVPTPTESPQPRQGAQGGVFPAPAVSQHPQDGKFARLEKETGVPAAIWQSLAETAKIDGGDGDMTTETQVLEIPPDAVSIREAARLHNISATTIWRWVNRGLIKVYFAGGQGSKTLIDRKELDRAARLYQAAPGQGRNPLRGLKTGS
ncbi:MAG: helix-turn-helix domain-containing protein [Chloroflexota bacterium]